MIDQEFQFKLQALLDGELSDREAAEVQRRVAGDSQAGLLAAELKNTSATLKGNESELKLPESREFFWSKIEREIERQEKALAADSRPVARHWWTLRRLAPVGAIGALCCLLILMLVQPGKSVAAGEMELASDDMGAYSFRDQQEKMTIVWFYDRTDDSQFTPAPSADKLSPQ